MAPRLALPGLVARAPALGAVTWRYFCHGDPGGELDPPAIPGSLLGWDRLFRLGNDTVRPLDQDCFPVPALRDWSVRAHTRPVRCRTAVAVVLSPGWLLASVSDLAGVITGLPSGT